jgi:outer membrane receptor for ferrienterochelin and colicin
MMNIRLLQTIVLCLVGTQAAFAQQAGLGSIIGIVQDASGSVIPAAKVVVSNEARGIKRDLETNAGGIFSAPSLVPSAGYAVTVNVTGFSPYERKDITVQVGQQLNLNIQLAVAAAAQTVEVESGAPIVETTRTGVSQVVTTEQIDNLPINGRRVDSFVLLTPGVTNDGQFGLVSFRGIAGGNSFLTDGNDTTNSFYNENAGRTRITTQISQDAVQEFQVLTNGYSAEFGRASGGVINTVTRSGTNDVHGTGYWFFRNRSLNARDRYASFNPPEVRHQAGGSIGGSIIQDKLFYFFNAEITRRDFPLVNRLINPNLFNSDGSLRERDARGVLLCGDPTARPRPATPAQCSAAFSILDRQFQTLNRTADSELGFGKIDWRPTDADSFSFSANYLRWISPNGIQTQAVLTNGNGIGNNANSTVRTRYGRAQWTRILGSAGVNEFRFGWFKDRLFDEVNPALIPPQTGRLGLTVAGQQNLGTAVDYPRLNPSEQRWQFVDTLSWVVGRHNLKLGVDFTSTRDYLNIMRNRFGSYTYDTFNSFALDLTGNTAGDKHWQSFSQTFGNPVLDFTTRDYAFFVQDQFRATPKLTLNYGLRYEFTDIQQPSTTNPAYPQTARIREPRKNFSPRFGVAYALDDQKTVLRGGFGIFYARIPGALLQNLYFNNGVYQPQLTLNGTVANDLARGPLFPGILPPQFGTGLTPPPGSIDVQYASADFRQPYTQQADIAIERQLTQNMGLTVSYVWTRGIGLWTTIDRNIGELGAPVTYRINDSSGNQVGSYTTPTYRLANRIDPRYRRLVEVGNGGQSWYNGLIVQLRKRMSHGLEGSVAYTWSHAIDTANQGGGTNALFYDLIRSTFNGDWTNDKGSSQLDQRHRLVISSIWAPTALRTDSGWAKYLVNGWQLAQITTLASAQPTTTTLRVVGAPFAGAAFNGSLNGLGGSNRVPFQPFSNLDIDQIYRVDARLTKAIPFTERVQLYLNFEAFNVFNTVSNTFVNTEAYSATGGVLTPSIGTGQGNQSQGFPDGTNARRAQVSLRVVF